MARIMQFLSGVSSMLSAFSPSEMVLETKEGPLVFLPSLSCALLSLSLSPCALYPEKGLPRGLGRPESLSFLRWHPKLHQLPSPEVLSLYHLPSLVAGHCRGFSPHLCLIGFLVWIFLHVLRQVYFLLLPNFPPVFILPFLPL